MRSGLRVGIDGGATKTRVMASYGELTGPAFLRDYPPSNYNNRDRQDIAALFGQICHELETRFGGEALTQSVLVLGSAGVDRPCDADVYRVILMESGFRGPLKIVNDADIALVGANGGRTGAILLVGTGSIAVGIAKDGRQVRTGGWGALIGDEGSGFRLGADGITAVMRSYDGVYADTALTKTLLRHFEVTSPEDLMDLVYLGDRLPVDIIASAAPLVLAAAEAGDTVAERIVQTGAHRLVAMVFALSKKMGSFAFRLSAVGGLVSNAAYYRDLISGELSALLPNATLASPLHEPVIGALILANELSHRLEMEYAT